MKKSVKKQKQKPLYTLSLTVGGVTNKSSGETVADALNDLLAPAKLTNKGSLTVSKGEKSRDYALTLPRLKKFLASKVLRQQFAKWAELRLS